MPRESNFMWQRGHLCSLIPAAMNSDLCPCMVGARPCTGDNARLTCNQDCQGKELISRILIGVQAIASTYAIESQAFVLHTTAVISQTGIYRILQPGSLMSSPGGGKSAIFAPDGRKLSTDLPGTEEGVIYATLGLDSILKSRAFIDVCGHYSRVDLLWLGVDRDFKKCVREEK